MEKSGTNRDLENRKFEIVSREGDIFGPFKTAPEAAAWAKKRWPDQEQRGENGTDGWDLRVEGVD